MDDEPLCAVAVTSGNRVCAGAKGVIVPHAGQKDMRGSSGALQDEQNMTINSDDSCFRQHQYYVDEFSRWILQVDFPVDLATFDQL